MPDGTPIRDHLGERVAVAAFLEPRETRTFELKATPGFLYFSNGPALTVTDELAVETQQVAFEYTGPRAESFEGAIAAGAVSFAFTNATDHRYALFVVNDLLEAPRVRELVDGHELTSESIELKGIQGAVRIHRLRMATPVE